MKKDNRILGFLVFVVASLMLIPNNLKALEMSDEFKTWLNEDGLFEVDAAKGTTEEDLALYLDFKYTHANLPYDILWGNMSEDLNSFDFTIYTNDEAKKETWTVGIKYNYDEKVNEILNSYLNSTLKDKTNFKVTDLELVSYWINKDINKNDNNSLALYSGELRKLLDYKNIQLFTDSRNGGANPFLTNNGGFASFQNNGISYKISPILSATAKHVIYVDDNTGDTKEDIVNAVQKRIDDYFGKDKVTIEYAGDDVLEPYEDDMKDYITDEWSDPNSDYNFLKEAYNGWYFFAHTQHGDSISSHLFVVQKDSSKMVEPIVKTVDSVTNVEISTDEILPLDTTIQANKLTSGDDYNKIVKLLNLTDNLTYDLKLYSDTMNKYITKLDSGEFEVKIPISEDFKGKDLVVYYVNENNETQLYDVVLKGDYAIFKTTHFSIYTLGYKESKLIFDSNGGTFKNNKKTIEVTDIINFSYKNFEKPTRKGYKLIGFYTEKTGGKSYDDIMNSEAGVEGNITLYARWEVDESVPKTSDNIVKSFFTSIICLFGLLVTIKYIKKK